MKSLVAIYVTAAILFFAALSHAEIVNDSSVSKLSGHNAVMNVDWNIILYIVTSTKAPSFAIKNESNCFERYKMVINDRATYQSQFESNMFDEKTLQLSLNITEISERDSDKACIKDLGVSTTQSIKKQISLP